VAVQKLKYSLHYFENCKTLKECGLKHGVTIQLSLGLMGGMKKNLFNAHISK